MLTRLANDTPLPVLVAAYAVFGVGLGSIGAPVNTTAVSGMPRSQAGLAAEVASTSRQVGASLGVALAGSLAGGGIEAAHRTDLAESTHPVFWVIVAFGVAIVVLGVISTGARARASAERVASLLGARDVTSPADPLAYRAAGPAIARLLAATVPPPRFHTVRYAGVLATCPRCSGRMRLLALITEPNSVAGFLRHLGEPTEPPARVPARDPPFWQSRVLRRRHHERSEQIGLFEEQSQGRLTCTKQWSHGSV